MPTPMIVNRVQASETLVDFGCNKHVSHDDSGLPVREESGAGEVTGGHDA